MGSIGRDTDTTTPQVDGLVTEGDAVVFYVHRDMPTEHLVQEKRLPSSVPLVRHSLKKEWLRAFTSNQTRALGASCRSPGRGAYPTAEAAARRRGVADDAALAPCREAVPDSAAPRATD